MKIEISCYVKALFKKKLQFSTDENQILQKCSKFTDLWKKQWTLKSPFFLITVVHNCTFSVQLLTLLIGRWGSLCVFWNCTLCGWKLRPCIRVLSSLGKLSSVLLPTWTAHIVENRVMIPFRLKKYKFYEYFLADCDQSLSGKIIFERENWRMEVFFTEWISACIKIYISHIYANIYGT